MCIGQDIIYIYIFFLLLHEIEKLTSAFTYLTFPSLSHNLPLFRTPMAGELISGGIKNSTLPESSVPHGEPNEFFVLPQVEDPAKTVRLLTSLNVQKEQGETSHSPVISSMDHRPLTKTFSLETTPSLLQVSRQLVSPQPITDGLTNDQDDQSPRADPHHNRFLGSSKILQFMLNATLVIMYAPLVSLVQLMFQHEEHSVFKTHGSFMIMSVVALTIATLSSGLLFYINDNIESQTRKHFSLVHYMILKSVFCFSGMLAPLSLLLVLFIRDREHHWIGYSIICALFGVVVASNFFVYIKLRGKKNNAANQMV
ncbi:hypothetical protein Hdeb2414_s0008g00265151 [Helianthus debilis subsp. tardiflorus]